MHDEFTNLNLLPAKPECLMRGLLMVQHQEGFVSGAAVKALCTRFQCTLADVESVLNFYPQFRRVRPASVHIELCKGAACRSANAAQVREWLSELTAGKTDFSVEEIDCLGACRLAPAIRVNGKVYGNLDKSKLSRILKKQGDKIMRTIPIPPGMQTELFVLDKGAVASLPEVLKQCFPGYSEVWIVADENTYKAAGIAAEKALKNAGFTLAPAKIFPGIPFHASEDLARLVASLMPEKAIPVAVGSGTVNDLVKRGSFLRNKRYCCVPTACSVDGYTSAGAALLDKGLKKTMPCPAPLAVCADSDVLQTAPAPMAAAGFADLAAKLTGGADWLMADAAGIEPIVPHIWDLVQKKLKAILADPDNMEQLFLGLAATGYAMQLYHDSRPASGAEHMISHVLEMEGFEFNGQTVSHGFQVAVGTVAVTRIMEFVINTPVEQAQSLAAAPETREERMANIAKLLERNCYGDGASMAEAKFLEPAAMLERRKQLFGAWEEIRKRYKEELWSSADLCARLRAAHSPVEPEDIGLDRDRLKQTILRAQLVRKRYTVLDLLYECGLLKHVVSQL